MTRLALTGIGAQDASVRAIVSRPIPRGLGFLRLSRWRSAQKCRCDSRRYDHRGHGTAINQDGWYTFYVANRYTFNCRLTLGRSRQVGSRGIGKHRGGAVFSHVAILPVFPKEKTPKPPSPSTPYGDDRGKFTHSFPRRAIFLNQQEVM